MAKAKKTQKYKLGNFGIGFEGVKVTQENCTDEIAKRLLLHNPALAKFFEKLPKNWQKDIQPSLPAKEVENE